MIVRELVVVLSERSNIDGCWLGNLLGAWIPEWNTFIVS